MRLWKSHENGVKIRPIYSSGNCRSTLPLSFTSCIAFISMVTVFGLFCYTVPIFSRGEIRMEGLGLRFEALVDSQPRQDKTLPPDNRQ